MPRILATVAALLLLAGCKLATAPRTTDHPEPSTGLAQAFTPLGDDPVPTWDTGGPHLSRLEAHVDRLTKTIVWTGEVRAGEEGAGYSELGGWYLQLGVDTDRNDTTGTGYGGWEWYGGGTGPVQGLAVEGNRFTWRVPLRALDMHPEVDWGLYSVHLDVNGAGGDFVLYTGTTAPSPVVLLP